VFWETSRQTDKLEAIHLLALYGSNEFHGSMANQINKENWQEKTWLTRDVKLQLIRLLAETRC
jgi:hypothetical protein